MSAVGVNVFIKDKNGVEVLSYISKIVTVKNDFELNLDHFSLL